MVYLVDFENVNSAGLTGIQKLSKEDKVYIFYTVNSASLSFAAHLNLLSCPAEVIYYYVASGAKNALDFQLASFLGYLISKGGDKNFCIISNDRGYEHVKNFWEKSGLASGISVSGAPSISRAFPAEKPFTARIQPVPPQSANKPVEAAPKQEKIAAAPAQEVPAKAAEPNTAAAPKPAEQPKAPAAKQDIKPAEQPKVPAAKPSAKPAEQPKAPAAKQSNKPAGSKQENKVPEKQAEAAPAPKKRGRPKMIKETAAAADPVLENLKTAMQKVSIPSDDKKIPEIKELLKRSEGKQQFYRGLISIFGMENGVEVYKVLRPEYTNLTKLAKQ